MCRTLPLALADVALRSTDPVHPGFSKENPMNSVALIGRLTANPQTHAGETHESATFRLAVA